MVVGLSKQQEVMEVNSDPNSKSACGEDGIPWDEHGQKVVVWNWVLVNSAWILC